MSDFEDTPSNAVPFSTANTSSPPDGQPPRHPSLTFRETIDLWSHATLLFHNFEWEQALSQHRRILRQCGPDVRKGFLWFNIGAIRGVLGEYYLAAESFAKAIKYEPDSAVSWYCLGISLFQLEAFRSAKKAFDSCLRTFRAEEKIDYNDRGLDFVLEKTRVEWNSRQALFEKNYKKARAPLPLGRHLGINSMPAGNLFEPPGFGDDDGIDKDLEATMLPETSGSAQPTQSSSAKVRQRVQTLLGREPKQSAKFEHSNARLQALDDQLSAESEPRRETIVPILAPSAAHRPQNAQLQPPNTTRIPTGSSGEDQKPLHNSSTWPKRSKPPTSLPFVTAKDLASANKASTPPTTSMSRTRARTIPPTSLASGVVYHEGSIITTEYIPTTTNIHTFMHTAPMALVQAPPSQYTHPEDVPAPLSIPQKQVHSQPNPTAAPSPTSVYSRPFQSFLQPDPDPLPPPRNLPKPNDNTATQTWLDTTFPPPRWDSLPPRLRPARRPSNYQPRHPERQQHPSSSADTGAATSSVNESRIKAPTPFADSLPHTNPRNKPDHNTSTGIPAPLSPPPLLPLEPHRDSTASMNSFAIIGMGRQAARWDEGVGWINGVGMATADEDETPPHEPSPRDGDASSGGKGKGRWLDLGSSLRRRREDGGV